MGSTGLIRFYIYFQFSCDHIYYRKGKKIQNFKFSMLKFTISVSNLLWRQFGPPLNFLPVTWNYPYPNFQRPTQFPHWFPGHQSWLIFFWNFKNGGFRRAKDFTDHIIVTPFSMFKDNSALSFWKNMYELIKTTYF